MQCAMSCCLKSSRALARRALCSPSVKLANSACIATPLLVFPEHHHPSRVEPDRDLVTLGDTVGFTTPLTMQGQPGRQHELDPVPAAPEDDCAHPCRQSIGTRHP